MLPHRKAILQDRANYCEVDGKEVFGGKTSTTSKPGVHGGASRPWKQQHLCVHSISNYFESPNRTLYWTRPIPTLVHQYVVGEAAVSP